MSGPWDHWDNIPLGCLVTCIPDSPSMAWIRARVSVGDDTKEVALFTACFPMGWVEITTGSNGWDGPWHLYEPGQTEESTGSANDRNERMIRERTGT